MGFLVLVRRLLVLWSSIRVPLATLLSDVSLRLPTILVTVLALVVLEARLLRGTLKSELSVERFFAAPPP